MIDEQWPLIYELVVLFEVNERRHKIALDSGDWPFGLPTKDLQTLVEESN